MLYSINNGRFLFLRKCWSCLLNSRHSYFIVINRIEEFLNIRFLSSFSFKFFSLLKPNTVPIGNTVVIINIPIIRPQMMFAHSCSAVLIFFLQRHSNRLPLICVIVVVEVIISDVETSFEDAHWPELLVLSLIIIIVVASKVTRLTVSVLIDDNFSRLSLWTNFLLNIVSLVV